MEPGTLRNVRILTGPTGSGKSEVALRVAERTGAEIVSLDSMTVYRGMDVGTAKPSAAERQRVQHHLIDVLDPWESSNVAWWLGQAAAAVRDIEQRGSTALFVGGTPFYLKALLHGLFAGPPADPALRHQLEALAARHGSNQLHRRLAEVDPTTAARVHVNDVRRIVRALEVFQLSGSPISSWQREWRSPQATSPKCWRIDLPRDQLYARIDRRVVTMIAAGWVNEARELLSLPRLLSREASQALGYRELFEWLAGKGTLSEAISRIQTHTRQFAKRQLTWFRSLDGCRGLPAMIAESADLLADVICAEW